MSESDVYIFKNENLKRIGYFLTIFFALPVGILFLMQGLSGKWVLIIEYSFTIPQPYSSILLMIMGIFFAIIWPFIIVDVFLYTVIIDQQEVQKKDLLSMISGKEILVNFQGIRRVVPHKKRKVLNKVVLYLNNGKNMTLKIGNLSKQNRSEIVSILMSHTH